LIDNASGAQMYQINVNASGNGYQPSMQPGRYIVKFANAAGTPYPAVRVVTLQPGDTLTLIVELTQATE
jgi:hypothetical protein